MTISARSWIPLAATVAAVMLAVSTAVGAQPRGAGQGGPRYDTATEATVTGTVEAVEQITGPGGAGGRRGLGGTHLTLKTGTETLEVHLGPTAFLNERKVVVAKGDTLEIVGSRVTVDAERLFIAKSVKKGGSVWTLREASGLPLWRRRGGRR